MTDEQKIDIAKLYEQRAMAVIHDERKFNAVMDEFEKIKKLWEKNND